MRTFEEYQEKLKGMRPNVYLGGELLERDDPRLVAGQNVIGTTYKAAQDPKTKDLVTTASHLTGKEINRYTHVPQSVDDLLKKQEMTRTLCGRVGGCIQRCMGNDSMCAISVVTKEMDDQLGTDYHQRFQNYLRFYQENDLTGNAAQTDVKGDRAKRPNEQDDPDLYLRVVEKRKDGIVVCGAKAHNTVGPYADEILVVPTRVMTKDEGDWAVSFAIQADAPGVTLICRTTQPRPRTKLMAPFNELGLSDSFTIFDNVFVPWERVFMCGEWQYAGRLALLFANYHRFSYCGCKPAVTDLMMGMAALVADYNGIGNASHVREEIAELMVTAELVYGTGIAAAVKARQTSSGTYEPNFIFSNAGRYYAGVNIYHEYDIVASLAGGLPATMPHEEDWFNEKTRGYLEKYVMRKPGISAENQHRLFRFISDFTCSSWSGVFQYAGIHGGGSPIMEKIGMRGQYDLKSKIELVKNLAGINE